MSLDIQMVDDGTGALPLAEIQSRVQADVEWVVAHTVVDDKGEPQKLQYSFEDEGEPFDRGMARLADCVTLLRMLKARAAHQTDGGK